MKWIKFSEQKPKDGQHCLVMNRYTVIAGYYCEEEEHFSIYMWQDYDFYGTVWMPIETFNDWVNE